ncbi:MAG: DUF3108 domain-containing protein [Acidobacteriota bacterium]
MKLLLAVIFAASALAAPSPVEQRFLEGETLDYNLTWLKVTGGTARMTISPIEDGSRYRITSVAHSSPGFSRFFRVRDEIETTVARSDFSTLRYVKRLDEDGDKIEETTVIEDGIATRTRKKVKKIHVQRPILDPISVIDYLRTVDLTPGKKHDLVLIADGKVYTVHALAVRLEKVETPLGVFECIRVEPRMVNGGVERQERLFIWYTNDDRKLPVRIRTEVKVGAITATLRGVTTGVTSIAPPVLTDRKNR